MVAGAGAPVVATSVGRVVEAARAAASVGPCLRSREAQLQATEAGEVITLNMMRADDKLRAACELIPLLPPYAMAGMLDVTVARLVSLDPDRAFAKLARVLSQKGVSSLKRATSAWTRLLCWADTHIEGDHGGVFDGMDTTDFLDAVHERAVAAVERRAAKRRAEDSARLRRGLAPRPPPAHPRDGSSARRDACDGLQFLRNNCKVLVASGSAVVRSGGFARRVPDPCDAIPVCALAGLDDSAAGHANEFVAGQSAAHEASSLWSLRLAQSGFVVIEFVLADTVHGFVGKDKHPRPEKQQARPFWGPALGVRHGRAFLARLARVLAGVEAGCFLLRDTDSPDGDPRKATRWVNAPRSAIASLPQRNCVCKRYGMADMSVPCFVCSTRTYKLGTFCSRWVWSCLSPGLTVLTAGLTAA